MNTDPAFREAVGKLRGLKAWAEDNHPEYSKIVSAQPEVLARYQAVFTPDGIPSLSEEEFRGFLRFENNRHWGLHRQGPAMCADMDLLRKALAVLVDQSRPIEERLDMLLPQGSPSMVPGLGRATVTAILLVVRPDDYSVWNSTSEGGLKDLGLFPQFERGARFSERYAAFNGVVKRIAEAVSVDIWTLDTLWWILLSGEPPPPPPPPPDAARFQLERYLHEFMRDNWGAIGISEEWELYEEDGEVVGYEYVAGDVGPIDLLAQHKTEPRWLVIELKRDQTSDATVGQVLRYMGWVKQNLASGDQVEGMIVAHSSDAMIRYALQCTCNVTVKLYEIDFRLRNPDE